MHINKFSKSLYNDLKPHIRRIASKSLRIYPKNPRWDLDELESVGWEAVIESWAKYDPSFGVPFKKYVTANVVHHILRFISANMFTMTVYYHNVKNKPDRLTKLHDTEVTMHRNTENGDIQSEHSGNRNLEFVPSKYLNTEEEVERKNTRETVRRMVQELNPEYRKLIKLRHIQGKTFNQIGKELGKKTETVRKQLQKIERILRVSAFKKGLI